MDAEFSWKVLSDLIATEELNILMYVIDMETNKEFVFGRTLIKLHEYLENKFPFWHQLNMPRSDSEEFGKVLVSLSYLPTSERLKVIVVEARDLKFRNGDIYGGL